MKMEEALDFGGFNDGFEFDVSDDERGAPAQAPWDFSGAMTMRGDLFALVLPLFVEEKKRTCPPKPIVPALRRV